MMKRGQLLYAHFTVATFFLLLILPGCYSEKTLQKISAPTVVSLKEHYPDLEKAAKQWRSEAVLVSVSISTGERSPDLITAYFRTPNLSMGLRVMLMRDGAIEKKFINTGKDLDIYPIAIEEIIDSQEALNLLLNKDRMELLSREKYRQCSSLSLDRERLLPREPAIWVLTIAECLQPYHSEYYYIDAVTGVELQVDR